MQLLNNLFGRRLEPSGSVAKQRLKLVLVQDRVKLPAEVLDAIREDIIQVISKYVDIDQGGIEVSLVPNGTSDTLMTSIPVLRSRV